jgi:hypothetical protein
MAIEKYLLKRKKELARRWFDLLAAGYPLETARLLKRETNQFANPVGQTFVAAVGEILDEFLGDNNVQALAPVLDRVLRIRAIQDFSPSSSLAFIFDLKKIARREIGEEIASGLVSREELSDFDLKVDGLAMLGFDVYVRCRQDLFEVRIKELRNRTNRLLKKAGILAEPGAEDE